MLQEIRQGGFPEDYLKESNRPNHKIKLMPRNLLPGDVALVTEYFWKPIDVKKLLDTGVPRSQENSHPPRNPLGP